MPEDPRTRTSRTNRPTALVDWRVDERRGRCVIAARAIAAGTEVERSPVILVPETDMLTRSDGLTVFEQYLLYWSEVRGEELVMGGGLLMFYNHSDTPNVEFETGPEPHTMSVIALRDIDAGEELMYDYGVPLWFAKL